MIKDVEPLLKECEETLAELMKMGNMEVACYVQGFINSINKLPDAEQKSHGKWVDRGHYMYCSVCDKEHDTKHNFCPNCGVKMR